jgi:ABC-2 type transport system ATP-binding protein
MTVVEFLRFIAEVRGFRGKEREAAVDRMRGLCALADVWYQPIETLSKGYRQRVGFAQALIHDPPVLILDEPTDGLDPNQKHEVRSLIKSMADDKTIILSTHILEEVEAVCERAIIIAKGRIVADGTPQDLLKMSPLHNAVTVKLQSSLSEALCATLESSPKVQKLEFLGETKNILRIIPRYGESIAFDVTELLSREKVAVEKIDVDVGRLDEVFRVVTQHQPTSEQRGRAQIAKDKSPSRHRVA